MARALVIGGTLFIGRALVDRLLERGDDVVIMHRGRGTPWGPRVGEIQCDRNDTAAVHAALGGKRFDVVYDNVYDWNRGTTAEQVSAAAAATAKGLRRNVFTSSVAVYPPGGEYPEDVELVPLRLLARVAGTDANLVPVPRERLQELGGGLLTPPYYFGAYLDVPPITVLGDRVRQELGLELTPLERGLSETFRWYEQQQRPRPDFTWEDEALATPNTTAR
jgi:NAD(P)-dependent dehydrogenase (short-subunit alcohol dehydrogenase family)